MWNNDNNDSSSSVRHHEGNSASHDPRGPPPQPPPPYHPHHPGSYRPAHGPPPPFQHQHHDNPHHHQLQHRGFPPQPHHQNHLPGPPPPPPEQERYGSGSYWNAEPPPPQARGAHGGGGGYHPDRDDDVPDGAEEEEQEEEAAMSEHGHRSHSEGYLEEAGASEDEEMGFDDGHDEEEEGGARSEPSDDENRDDDSDDGDGSPAAAAAPPIRPRGKPEAMAAALAAKHAAANRQELLEDEEENEADAEHSAYDASADADDQDAEEVEAVAEAAEEEAEAEAVEAEEVEVVVAEPVAAVVVPAKKPAASASKPKKSTPKKRNPPPKQSSPPPSKSKKKNPPPASSPTSGPASSGALAHKSTVERTELLLSERAPSIQPAEWENLEALMHLFCKVPLLAEFSRPVSLLHPELVAGYSKIVLHPVDLGHICRGIRRRQYKSLRDVRLDMWRVFANCVKFHSHPHNREAVPSFVSIALHLREYFNMLWQEFLLPSDVPDRAPELTRRAFQKRSDDRKRRIESSGVLVMTKRYIIKTAQLVLECLERGGRVDGLDTEPVLAEAARARNADLAQIYKNLWTFAARLADPEQAPEEYTLEEYYRDLRSCYQGDVLEDQPALLNRIRNRVERLFWKRTVPLHEGNTRGVGQSSIWGNVAATIWARENSKKPYWPALCLGILPPKEQREGWHAAVTERNESRLPEKLRVQLVAAKKKCEHAQKRQNLSYFLVEFLGTHEFVWCRELDIIESFDPAEDPNKSSGTSSKKKRASRSDISSVLKSKTYLTALEECKWAQEEFENVLQDALDDEPSEEQPPGDEEEMNYSYSVLAQSDDEADEEVSHGYQYEEDEMSESDAEEANYLLSNDGMIDISSIGTKKKAKKKVTVPKKKPVEKEKKDSKQLLRKAKAEKAEQLKKLKVKEMEDKKEQRELERRRKKRTREREKALREESRKQKRRRMSYDSDDGEPGLAWDKRARATAIAKAYVIRTAKVNEDYKSLALNGVMTMPAAMVDPTGLLGMALAFRAAAGVLNMPDDSEEQITKSSKPWAAIDTTSGKTSAERTDRLEQKIKMLEREIKRVKVNTTKRRELTEIALSQRFAMDQRIEAEDLVARNNPFKKKKPVPEKDKAASNPGDASEKLTGSRDGGREESLDRSGQGDEAMADADDDASVDDKMVEAAPADAAIDQEEEDDEEVAPVSEVVLAGTKE